MTITNKDRSAYASQKSHAKQRGITFNLTFDEWYDWWQATGHYLKRGRKADCYVMARLNDSGPYEISNIYCCTVAENARYGNKLKPRTISKKTRDAATAANTGRTHSKASRDKMSAAQAKWKRKPEQFVKMVATRQANRAMK
ncbi:hypothetical protein [Burkholderia gladioli]|uniref:hypothetical protein n=1 Tax=Burkholderia gladioli TaxID=28095 RepID=UPI00163F4C4F|nr:hypothetical protein [Burkholderia gladioli]